MKVKLALAFAALLFATLAHADSLTDGNGTIYYPNGSTITSYTYVPSTAANGFLGESVIDFQFAGGYGVANNFLPADDEESGSITFTSPFSDLLVGWAGDIYMNFVGPNGEIGSVCDGVAVAPGACGPDASGELSGMTFITGPVSSISWDTLSNYNGAAGITSLTDPVQGVPEPSSLLLSGISLAALLGLFGKLKIRAANN
jgi:hypothetical protein